MGMYSTNNRLAGSQQNLSTSFKSLVGLNAATASLRRGRLWEIEVGTDAAPNATDCPVTWDIARQTAAGTGTSATPLALNPADAASDTVATVNYTAEPTVTAASTLLALALNQRASQRWVAFSPDQALVWPATNLAGLVIRALSPTYASVALATAIHEDL